MARGKRKESTLTLEEKMAQALVPDWEQPYKVPSNWFWAKISGVAEILNGYAFKSSLYVDSGIRIIRIANVQDGYIHDESPAFYPNNYKKEIEQYLLNEGDLLISLTGNVGRVAILPASFLPAALNQRVACLRCTGTVSKNFLFYYLLQQEFQDSCIRNSKGIAQLNMSTEWLKEQPLCIPPLGEQRRIVDRIERLFLKLDEAKEKAQYVLDSFETRKATILHKAFTGELTAKWRAENGVELDSWNQGCLNDFCEVNPKKAATKDLPDDLEVSFVPMTALSDTLGEITDPQVRKLQEVRNGFTNFSEGDVVFAKITPCMENGKTAVVGPLVNNLGFGTTEFYVLRCSKMLFNRYLYHLVRSRTFRAEAKAVMTGAVGQQRVPKSFLEDYPLTIPSVPEQIEIVRILDSLFTKEQQAKEAAEAVLEKIDLLKKSILARAFRGELGTNYPSEESALELLKQVLQEDAPAVTKKRSKSIPKELQTKLSTELERQIVKLYFKQETDSLPAEELLSVSSKKFEVMATLHNLEQAGTLKRLPNGNYRLLE